MTSEKALPKREMIRARCLFLSGKRKVPLSVPEIELVARISRGIGDGLYGESCARWIRSAESLSTAENALPIFERIAKETTVGIPTCGEIEAASPAPALCRRCRYRGFIKTPLDLGDTRPAVHSISADDLDRLEIDPPKMIVENLIPSGLSILAGRPKRGKSWMALSLALSVASGGPALGSEQVHQGSVLVGALEDSPARMKSRLQRLLGAGERLPKNLHLTNQLPRIGAGLVEALTSWLDRNDDAALVVLDTFQKIRAPRVRGADPYETDYAALEGLQRLALERGIGIVVLHHTRKASQEGDSSPFDTIHGSTAIFGVADAALVLAPSPVGQNNAILHVTARDFSAEDRSMIFDDGLWTIDQENRPEDLKMTGECKRVVDLLRTTGPLFPKEIAEKLSIPSVEGLHKRLFQMKNRGFIFQEGARGRYCVTKGKEGNERKEGKEGKEGKEELSPSSPSSSPKTEGRKETRSISKSGEQPSLPSLPSLHSQHSAKPEKPFELKADRQKRELLEKASESTRDLVARLDARISDPTTPDADRNFFQSEIKAAVKAGFNDRAVKVLEAKTREFLD